MTQFPYLQIGGALYSVRMIWEVRKSMWGAFEKKITSVKDYNDRRFQQDSPFTQQYLKRHTQNAAYHTADFMKGVAFSIDAEN